MRHEIREKLGGDLDAEQIRVGELTGRLAFEQGRIDPDLSPAELEALREAARDVLREWSEDA